MRRCDHDYHCFMIFCLISSDNILFPAFRLQLACAQGGHVTVKSFGRLFPVSWLCFTSAFFTLPFKNILCSYVLYTHRCFSPVQLYYPLRLSPSLKTRRRRAAGVGGGRRCFMMFLFHFFLLRHLAYGVIRTITYAWSCFAFLMN